jgi:2'-5' RNA ligase
VTESVAAVYSPPRTYPIPQAVVAEAVQGFRWARAYDVDVPEVYQHTAAVLASGGSVDLVELARLYLLSQSYTDTLSGWNPGEEGYPCRDRVLASLAGGYYASEWTEKIFSAIETDVAKQREAVLASIEFDSTRFTYVALSRPDHPDLITDLIRVDPENQWTRLNPKEQSWDPVEYEQLRQHEAIAPDSNLVADLVAALKSGEHLLLHYGEPVAFLPSEPALAASGAIDDVEEETIFAIVDEVDTTAVLAAICVTPGPVVCVREDGCWVPDEEFQTWFLSSEPPTLVAVGAAVRDNVIAQIDSWQGQRVVKALADASELESSTIDPQPVVDLADGLLHDLNEIKFLQQKAQEYELKDLLELNDYVNTLMGRDQEDRESHRQFLLELEDEGQIAAAYDKERERRIALRASLHEVADKRELMRLRTARDTLKLYGMLASLEDKIQAYELFSGAPFTAAGGWDRNRGNAENLRRYWLRGRGAAKIRWGTKGDWRRCYRQLFKHLGPRAKGYCQLRHKEATGLYTGDKLHRRGVNAVKASGEGAGSANPKAHTGVMVALFPPESVAKQIALPDGEPIEELHVTIGYLGDYQDLPITEQQLVDVVRNWAPTSDVQDGVYSGKGLFVGEEIPEGCCTILTVDINTLPQFHRHLVDVVNRLGNGTALVKSNHGFTPHTTLAYGNRLDEVEISEPIPVRFEQISVVWGSSRTDITLGDS